MVYPADTLHQIVSYSVKFNNTELSSEYQLAAIDTTKEINKISQARVAILGGDPKKNEFEESEETMFQPGKSVEIKLGYKESNTTVFKGIVEKVEIKLEEGYEIDSIKSLMILNCVDKAIKLKNSNTTDIYENKKDSEIMTTLISKAGLTKKITATKIKHDFFPKYNINDWDFILRRAMVNSLIVVNSNNELDIKKPSASSSPSLTIKNGGGTISFNGKLSAQNQLQKISFNSYDPFGEKSSKKSAAEPSLTAQGSLKSTQIASFFSPSEYPLNLPQPIESNELLELANSELQNGRLNRIFGEVKVKGVKTLDLDQLVKLEGFGKLFDGSCYVTKVKHELKRGAYFTTIGFGLDGLTTFKRDNIDVEKLTPYISGTHIGKVKKVDKDPDNEYRIQVVIPVIKSTGDGIWARLTHFYTGSSSSGSFFIPEINSQVVISFIGNDLRYPVIIGGLFTKSNKPKEKSITKDNFIKEIRTKNDLKIHFDDDKKILSISTAKDKQIIEINDDKKQIEIKDMNGNTITTSSKGIVMKSKKEISIQGKTIKLKGTSGVTIDGKSGSGVKVNGSNVQLKASAKLTAKGGSGADLQASGKVNIKGATVNIN